MLLRESNGIYRREEVIVFIADTEEVTVFIADTEEVTVFIAERK